MRLTRDLEQLDRLIADAQAIADEARRHAPPGTSQAWDRVLLAADRRLYTYHSHRGAIAQAMAAAGLRDRYASFLTGRARLVLHRYVRHFAGRPRRTREVARLHEIIADLRALQERLEPVQRRVQVPSVAEEIAVMSEFLAFFDLEVWEVERAVRNGSPEEQAIHLAAIAGDLIATWDALVLGEDRAVRRLGLLERLLGSLDVALGQLMVLRPPGTDWHLDPDVARAARALAAWQDEVERTRQAHAALAAPERRLRLVSRAAALRASFRDHLSGEPVSRDREALRTLCDRMDEVERQLAELDDARRDLEPDPEVACVRDVLVAMMRTYDRVTAAQEAAAA